MSEAAQICLALQVLPWGTLKKLALTKGVDQAEIQAAESGSDPQARVIQLITGIDSRELTPDQLTTIACATSLDEKVQTSTLADGTDDPLAAFMAMGKTSEKGGQQCFSTAAARGKAALDVAQKATPAMVPASGRTATVQNKDTYPDVVLWSLDRKTQTKMPNGDQVTIIDEIDNQYKVRWNDQVGLVKQWHIQEDSKDDRLKKAEQLSDLANKLNIAVDKAKSIRQEYQNGSIEAAVATSRLAQVESEAKSTEGAVDRIHSSELDDSLRAKKRDLVNGLADFFQEVEEFFQKVKHPTKGSSSINLSRAASSTESYCSTTSVSRPSTGEHSAPSQATTRHVDPTELAGMCLRDVKQRARDEGVEEAKIDAAEDTDDPKGAAIQLILAHRQAPAVQSVQSEEQALASKAMEEESAHLRKQLEQRHEASCSMLGDLFEAEAKQAELQAKVERLEAELAAQKAPAAQSVQSEEQALASKAMEEECARLRRQLEQKDEASCSMLGDLFEADAKKLEAEAKQAELQAKVARLEAELAAQEASASNPVADAAPTTAVSQVSATASTQVISGYVVANQAEGFPAVNLTDDEDKNIDRVPNGGLVLALGLPSKIRTDGSVSVKVQWRDAKGWAAAHDLEGEVVAKQAQGRPELELKDDNGGFVAKVPNNTPVKVLQSKKWRSQRGEEIALVQVRYGNEKGWAEAADLQVVQTARRSDAVCESGHPCGAAKFCTQCGKKVQSQKEKVHVLLPLLTFDVLSAGTQLQASTCKVDPTELAGMCLRDVKQRARDEGIEAAKIDAVDDADNPKAAAIQLILAHRQALSAKAANLPPLPAQPAKAATLPPLPDVYIITHPSPLPINETCSRSSAEIALIPPNARVDVLEVATQDDGGRIRARIREPAGWISIGVVDGSASFASKATCPTHIVLNSQLPVNESYDRNSAEKATLTQGMFVEILETSPEPNEGRMRARIAYPRGWISTAKADGSATFVEAFEKTYIVSQDIRVSEAQSRSSRELTRLPKGTRVEMVEAAHQDGRIRIACPAGWISADSVQVGRHLGQPEMLDPRGRGGTCRVIGFYYPGHAEKWDRLCQAGFMGNFWECPIKLAAPCDPEVYKFTNAESAFQALKFWKDARVFEPLSADEAFKEKVRRKGQEDFTYGGFGRGKRNANWYGMEAVLKQKFAAGSNLAQKLVATGDAFLLEHNSKSGRDRVWSDNLDGTGTNWLGLQLMKVRDELNRKQDADGSWSNFFIDKSTGELKADKSDAWQNDAVKPATTALIFALERFHDFA